MWLKARTLVNCFWSLYVVAGQWRTRWSRHEKAAATAQTVALARTSERRDGPVREEAPYRSTGTEGGQGREWSAWRTTSQGYWTLHSPRRQVCAALLSRR